MIHHYNKGKNKVNYNIILPGVDYLMGTYKSTVDNREFCKKHKYESKKIKNFVNFKKIILNCLIIYNMIIKLFISIINYIIPRIR